MIKNISVIGAGTMGHAIAIVFALYDYKVSVFEKSETVRNSVTGRMKAALEFMVQEDYIPPSKVEGALANISLYSELAPCVKDADYVLEAAFEDMALKQKLFQELDALCPPHTILSSNTSSLPLAGMMELMSEERKARTMVCHWYNPGHLVPIAELSFFGNMSEELYNEVYELYVKVGKQPVKVVKDIPGLIANRLLAALAREVYYLIELGAASAEDVDKALKFGPGFRGATTGILEMSDMGGLDIWCTVHDNLLSQLSNAGKACDMLRQKVSEGKLGLKTGEGFYKYPDEVKDKIQNDFYRRLIIQLKASSNY